MAEIMREVADWPSERQIAVVGRFALWFWSGHAVKEVKVLDLTSAGS
jgi:hypothetical protein